MSQFDAVLDEILDSICQIAAAALSLEVRAEKGFANDYDYSEYRANVQISQWEFQSSVNQLFALLYQQPEMLQSDRTDVVHDWLTIKDLPTAPAGFFDPSRPRSDAPPGSVRYEFEARRRAVAARISTAEELEIG